MAPAMQLFTNPASTTERLHLSVAEYDGARRPAAGGKPAGEGEEIEVIEMDFDDAPARIETGEIVDARTLLILLHLPHLNARCRDGMAKPHDTATGTT